MFQYKNPYNLKHVLKMNPKCTVCGQPLDMEPGFYYGTNMISYALALVLCIISFAAWWIIIGFSLHDSRFVWWLGVNGFLLIALQPPLMRISRTVWLQFFVPYSPAWSKGDIIQQYNVHKEHMNNW